MEQDFNANLRRLRKQKGWTQEQLADAVGVSAQAVSKWEQNGFPDTPLLSAIADSLDVSIDALFGRGQDTSGPFDQILQYLLSFSPEERTRRAFDLCWMICQVFMNRLHFDPLPDQDPHETRDQYVQIINNNGVLQARVNGSLPYFFLLQEPENGYDGFLAYDKRYVELFEILAFPDALRALYFLAETNDGQTSSEYAELFFTEQALAYALSIETAHAKEIIQKLLSVSLISKRTLDIGEKKKPIYVYTAGHHFVAFMTFTHALLNPAYYFCFCSFHRTKPLFSNATYRNMPDSGKKDRD
ncbi:MAG: helix-turn-helix transcriptional regulator [Clostridium sp.]|nr:helix-turn-helix transcriptional regulator [Clostridium sp.]